MVTEMPRVAKTAKEDEQTNAAELERPDPAQREGPKLNRKGSSTLSVLAALLASSAAGVNKTSKTLQQVQMWSSHAMLDAKLLPKVNAEATVPKPYQQHKLHDQLHGTGICGQNSSMACWHT